MRPIGPDGKPAERTRAQDLQRNGQRPSLPPAPAHLLAWLHELGVCASGPQPLPATEIATWANACGRRLARWEFTALLEASRAFVGEYHAGNPLPPDNPVPQPDQKALSSQLKTLAAQLNRKPST